MKSRAMRRSKLSDRWETPGWLLAYSSRRYGPFDLDLFAEEGNAKARRYLTAADDTLKARLRCRRGHANPPYSQGLLGLCVARCREVVELGWVKVALGLIIPHSPGVGWWREHVRRAGAVHLRQERAALSDERRGWRDVYRDGPLVVEVTHSFGRVAFDRPPGYRKKSTCGAFESAVVGFCRASTWTPPPLAPGELCPNMPGWLGALRRERGHTQGELAQHLGVSQGEVSKWETGSRTAPAWVAPKLLEMPAGAREGGRGPYRPRAAEGQP
jgi:phage N-6-adenine-methyltransferase